MGNEITYMNEEILKQFTNEEKGKLFDSIADMYFKKNFGSISKSDFETYLFSVYIEHLLDNGETIDDYSIGRDLGITISRVRSLKERKELKYPRMGYDWKDSFLKYARYAKYDDVSKLIKFQIPDVNVIKDARYFFEKNNEYDEFQLNPKLFQCSLEAFERMGKMIAEEKGENYTLEYDRDAIKKIVNSSRCNEKEKNALTKILGGAAEDGLKELLIGGTKIIIKEVLKLIVPGGGVISKVINIIINALEK